MFASETNEIFLKRLIANLYSKNSISVNARCYLDERKYIEQFCR